jgi:ribosomal-protein-alanine N-acetyltransferase
MHNIVLETERLILRPWKYEDAKDLVEGLNNLEVSKWLAFVPYPYTLEDAKKFIEFTFNSGNYEFAIVLKSENKVIGGTALAHIKDNSAGGGIWLNRKYWGKGYGKEAYGKRVEFAFNDLNLEKLENGYFKGNEKSFKMQESLGYKRNGINKNKYVSRSTGKVEDEYKTLLLKEDWKGK